MAQDYNDSFDEEDIAALEDRPGEEALNTVVDAAITNLPPDMPVYRLRLPYSNETFLAAYKGGVLKAGDEVLVPTRYGKDLAEVIGEVRALSGEIVSVERPALESDLAKARHDRDEEAEALRVCKQKIEAHGLEMKLVSVHYLLEESKILFFFTAENRVDFRDLVKDLVSIFRMRIELRQIGVRDESRVVGGLGICGRGYCCNMVSDKLKPVSIKMAKDQNLSLNSMKISGPCGRLLCCLAYEHNFYNEQRRIVPQEGARVNHDGTTWKVTEVNIVSSKLSLSADDGRILSLPFSRFAKNEGRWEILGEKQSGE